MEYLDILKNRVTNQCIFNGSETPESVLYKMGAVQAQDYTASLWAIGLRCREGTTVKDVERAILEKKIARTWLMRGTIHFATSSDIHWMIKLFAPRLLNTAMMRDQHLGLSNKTVEKAKELFYNALKKEGQLTRKDMYKLLEKISISSKNNLGYHMLYRAAWDGLICFGPYSGKEQTFVLLDEHIKERKTFSQEDANTELAKRYFTSHGPATIKDYIWWSGLTVKDAKNAIEILGAELKEEKIDGIVYYMSKNNKKFDEKQSVYLLPAFDEYLVGYANREAMLNNLEMKQSLKRIQKTEKNAVVHSNGIFLPVIVVDNEVVGVWSRKSEKTKITITLKPYIKLNKDITNKIREEVQRYGNFFGVDAFVKC